MRARGDFLFDIYVGNLPDHASADELHQLLVGVVGRQSLGMMSVSALTQKILNSLGGTDGESEPQFTVVESASARYCRIWGHSRDVANKMIDALSGVALSDNALDVRPFHVRNRSNDRRRAGWRFRRWLGVEQRDDERRAVE